MHAACFTFLQNLCHRERERKTVWDLFFFNIIREEILVMTAKLKLNRRIKWTEQ